MATVFSSDSTATRPASHRWLSAILADTASSYVATVTSSSFVVGASKSGSFITASRFKSRRVANELVAVRVPSKPIYSPYSAGRIIGWSCHTTSTVKAGYLQRNRRISHVSRAAIVAISAQSLPFFGAGGWRSAPTSHFPARTLRFFRIAVWPADSRALRASARSLQRRPVERRQAQHLGQLGNGREV